MVQILEHREIANERLPVRQFSRHQLHLILKAHGIEHFAADTRENLERLIIDHRLPMTLPATGVAAQSRIALSEFPLTKPKRRGRPPRGQNPP